MTCPEEHVYSIVKGVSMQPLLRTGDRLELRPVERGMLRRGDVIVFYAADGREIVHRVVRLAPLQTRGDNCACDDAPVPEDSPVATVIAYRRNGLRRRISGGAAGMRRFRLHQLRRRVWHIVRVILSPAAAWNPFRIPFDRLSRSVFGDKTFYYAGKHPVGWVDADGWHWMRFGRFRVKDMPEFPAGTP